MDNETKASIKKNIFGLLLVVVVFLVFGFWPPSVGPVDRISYDNGLYNPLIRGWVIGIIIFVMVVWIFFEIWKPQLSP